MECLETLYKITYPNYNVILIDNDSKDESIEKIKEYCDGKIEVNSKFFSILLKINQSKSLKFLKKMQETMNFIKKEEFLT